MISPDIVLSTIPASLRKPLFDCYRVILRNFTERRWEPTELNGGKFSEIVYSILKGALTGSYPTTPSKPSNMLDACKALEALPANSARVGDRSLRILIPRTLPVLYEIRNNRNVGHVGGDVDPNFQDSSAVLQLTSWIMAELVRIFHDVDLSEAEAVVATLNERKHPVVWQDGDLRRVLDTSLSKTDQCMLLLYSKSDWTDESELFLWVEYKNLSLFRSRILSPLHDERIAEYNKKERKIKLTSKGLEAVEKNILVKYI